ncbi:hypothetical protein NL676_021117 [Syzygium grande]|nr:hypothetical protein NL676_021117 [Syzygium grande]
MEDAAFFDLADFLRKPSVAETFVDILLCAVPIWLAVMIGLLIGWSWRPRWTGLVYLGLRSKFRFLWTAAPPGFGARRLWLAFTALSAFSALRAIWSGLRNKGKSAGGEAASPEGTGAAERSGDPVKLAGGHSDIVTENDLEHLLHLLEGKEGDMEWQSMMERSTPNMAYQAWRHEPKTGPIIFRSRTVFEDATAEVVRDFFWDDEFRPKWDPMLAYCKTLEECPHTGTMILHWIKKFPFFCSDREYIIGRRIWEAGKTYYCVTKGVPYLGLRNATSQGVLSSTFLVGLSRLWNLVTVMDSCLHARLLSCIMRIWGFPKMWPSWESGMGCGGTVKKLHSGMRGYQNARKMEAALSRSALMARITTKISFDGNSDSMEPVSVEEDRDQSMEIKRHEENGLDWKWVVLGGTVALVFGLHSGAIGKALLLGAGNRIARR